MPDNPNKGDFISHAGTTMTIIAWLIFLAFLFGIFDYFVEKRNNPNQNVITNLNGSQKEVTLQRNAHGHYVTNGSINGNKVVFLLDTGATDVAIPESLANDIGLIKGRSITVKTANGNVRAYRTHLKQVGIGDITRYDIDATILTNISGNEILLGMTFLKHFELIQKGKKLTIRQ